MDVKSVFIMIYVRGPTAPISYSNFGTSLPLVFYSLRRSTLDKRPC